MSALDRLMDSVEKRKSEVPQTFYDEAFADKCPSLHHWMSAEEWNGRPRKTPTINLFVDQGRLKCCFSDKQTGFCAFWTLSDPVNLVHELESALNSENLEWRPPRMPFKGNGKSKSS